MFRTTNAFVGSKDGDHAHSYVEYASLMSIFMRILYPRAASSMYDYLERVQSMGGDHEDAASDLLKLIRLAAASSLSNMWPNSSNLAII